ncbi:gastrula zinc finger protein XlCGF66.1-like isoform X1 [Mercenaria mercenaria]|uniref:gastrula zinc finger protein XlCGF66.1-like isoform X1 n=2 Tax=Mercenaria mercenaria TaxID=6596 RepID=UPI001E1DEC98|nr:gastrula zinc finger protein XlCGF66.1-like isoform X1 [Mercenaria mercenaria]
MVFYMNVTLFYRNLLCMTAKWRKMEKSEDGLMCRYCGRQFKSKSGLSNHENRHNDQAPYRCCGHKIYSRANLMRHRCAVHNEVKQFACKKCDKTFAMESDMKRHERSHEQPAFKCTICGVETKYLHRFQDHVAAHDSVRKYSCKCGKTYKYRSNLQRHKASCK